MRSSHFRWLPTIFHILRVHDVDLFCSRETCWCGYWGVLASLLLIRCQDYHDYMDILSTHRDEAHIYIHICLCARYNFQQLNFNLVFLWNFWMNACVYVLLITDFIIIRHLHFYITTLLLFNFWSSNMMNDIACVYLLVVFYSWYSMNTIYFRLWCVSVTISVSCIAFFRFQLYPWR